MIVKIPVADLINNIKSEIWPICHCLGLGHETMACAVCLSILLLHPLDHIEWLFITGFDKFCKVSIHDVQYNMSWNVIAKPAANIYMLFFIQMNYVWYSADNKPCVTADWNNGLYMNTRRVYFNSVFAVTDYYFSSVIDPGTDGSCVVIVYIREYKPLWKMFPCDETISLYWICKSPIKTHNAIHKMVYPSLWCANRYLLINNTCYQYIFLPSTNNDNIKFRVAKLDVLYLNRVLANHGVEVYFLGSGAVNMAYKQSVQGGLAFPYTNVSFRSTGVKKFELQKWIPIPLFVVLLCSSVKMGHVGSNQPSACRTLNVHRHYVLV